MDCADPRIQEVVPVREDLGPRGAENHVEPEEAPEEHTVRNDEQANAHLPSFEAELRRRVHLALRVHGCGLRPRAIEARKPRRPDHVVVDGFLTDACSLNHRAPPFFGMGLGLRRVQGAAQDGSATTEETPSQDLLDCATSAAVTAAPLFPRLVCSDVKNVTIWSLFCCGFG